MRYLYNNIALPALPDWDKETYPYAVIVRNEDVSPGYWFVASESTYAVTESNGFMPSVRGDDVQYLYDVDTQTWTESEMSMYAAPCVKWANYDVYDTDGTLYLAASEPVPVTSPYIDPKSLLMGYRVGCILRAMRNKKREPVAYLYNGVQLPPLPEWDKTVYPYAYITLYPFTEAAGILWLSKAPFYADRESETMHTIDSNGIDTSALYYAVEGNAWIYKSTWGVIDHIYEPLWSNADMLLLIEDEETGEKTVTDTVYISASEPVPVYE